MNNEYSMQYREYGKTGVKVSALGFGTLRYPKVKGRSDADLFVEIMKHAFDLGVNYVDTAVMDAYRSEKIVSKAIKGRKEKIHIASKNHYKGTSGKEWQKLLDKSLKELGVDSIDFYHLHAVKWSVFRKMQRAKEPIERFSKAKEEGLIKHMCFSTHDRPEGIRHLIDTGLFDGMLVQYNLLDRKNEDVIAYAHERGMGVAIMGPVGGGKLAPMSGTLQKMAGAQKSTPELALRFVLSNPNVTVALSGMNAMHIVDENVATASREDLLSPKEQKRFNNVIKTYKDLAKPYCVACGYCMPCPNYVDIPSNLAVLDYYKVWGLKDTALERYKKLQKNKKRREAEACVECGECELKCPQDIPIRKRLHETASLFA